MQRTHGFAVLLALWSTVSPISAQQPEPDSMPIRHAIARETSRLAAESAQAAAPTGPDPAWVTVRHLPSGTDIIVTRRGPTVERAFVLSADTETLVLLDLSSSAIGPAQRHALEGIGRDHPNYFDRARAGDTFVLPDGLRITRDGIFVRAYRAGSLDDFVRTVSKADLIEIREASGSYAMTGAKIGVGIGAAIGGMMFFSTALCDVPSCRGRAEAGRFALFALPIAGGVLGYKASQGVQRVIYSAPSAAAPDAGASAGGTQPRSGA